MTLKSDPQIPELERFEKYWRESGLDIDRLYASGRITWRRMRRIWLTAKIDQAEHDARLCTAVVDREAIEAQAAELRAKLEKYECP